MAACQFCSYIEIPNSEPFPVFTSRWTWWWIIFLQPDPFSWRLFHMYFSPLSFLLCQLSRITWTLHTQILSRWYPAIVNSVAEEPGRTLLDQPFALNCCLSKLECRWSLLVFAPPPTFWGDDDDTLFCSLIAPQWSNPIWVGCLFFCLFLMLHSPAFPPISLPYCQMSIQGWGREGTYQLLHT